MDAAQSLPTKPSYNDRLSRPSVLIPFLAICLTVLFSVPFAPQMPRPGLDESWRYAMNEAVAQHLSFGKDIVFTFDPLASVYTGLYHASTDPIMLLGRALVSAGFAIGCVLIAYPNRW
jgi:hypothetical protein